MAMQNNDFALHDDRLHDDHLRDVLVELANLRMRDERMRRASEALAEALESLVEERDWKRLPQMMLERLEHALETPLVAIRAYTETDCPQATGERASADFLDLLAQPALLAYLAKKPQRVVSDIATVAASLGLSLPRTVPEVLLTGRLRFDEHGWLVLCAGARRLAEPDAHALFRRFLPVFAPAMQRLIEGRRTEDLERREREIHLAKEKAEAASRAKSEFVSRMSHELRTPLNAIIGFTEILKGEPLLPSQYSYVHLIANAGQHLLDLINTVLDHAKIEAGKLTLESVPFNLRELIDTVITMVDQQASAKGLVFETFCSQDLPSFIVGDPTRLRQILINLLSNAIKFTEQGTVTLRMATEDHWLYFSVRDTGIGMNEVTRSHLFQAFSQADESIARKFGGTGLGLLIARDLLQAMGGKIEVDSAPGAGTCFFGQLPLHLPTKGVAPPLPVTTPEIDQQLANPLVGRRILVVDDNSINRKLTGILLERMDIVVSTAENGRAALERIARGGLDLVLMDVEMPEMDGLEATRTWRAVEAKRGVARLPIIALTANAMAEDRVRCDAAGMDGYVVKPIVVAQLRSELERVLGQCGVSQGRA